MATATPEKRIVPSSTNTNWLDADFPSHKVSERTRADVQRFSMRVRGSARVAKGSFATDAELEQRRLMVSKLP